MKLQVDVYTNYEEKVGKIWTNGKAVFMDPANDKTLKYIVGRPVSDYYYNPITAQADPVQFVKLLWANYKSQGIAASEPYEVSRSKVRRASARKKQGKCF